MVETPEGLQGAESLSIVLREEAHRMAYRELFAPEKRGVVTLLANMIAAMKATRRTGSGSPPNIAPTFLVAGPRGTGKTTVLVNARHACESGPSFFEGEVRTDELPANELEALRRNVMWLDPLDME